MRSVCVAWEHTSSPEAAFVGRWTDKALQADIVPGGGDANSTYLVTEADS